MTGKLTVKGRQTRQRIVAAAAELMFEGGVARTTMEDVRAAAGSAARRSTTTSPIKKPWSGRSSSIRTRRSWAARNRCSPSSDTLAGLRAWRDFLVAHQRALNCRGGCPIGSLGSELAEADPRARAAVARGFGRWEAGIRGGYQAMHDRGELTARR